MTEVIPVVSMRAHPTAVAPAARGLDREGFAVVFRAHHASLLRLGFLLCGHRDRAEDAVAEAFARTWPHWERGDVIDEKAYLRRALVNELRSRARRRVVEDRDLAWRRGQGRPGPKDAAEVLPERLRLLAALAQLPGRQRAVVVLRFYEDLTAEDTAVALGMRVGTVKSQTSRGLDRLRSILDEEE